MRWRVYFGDSTTFDDSDGKPYFAPALNVQAICMADADHGWSVLWKHDFYWWEEAAWYGGDLFGMYDYLTRPGPRRVLFGRTIPIDDLNAIMARLEADTRLPAKTGWRPEERRP